LFGPVFNTLGRDEMLADARTGRNRRNALVGAGVADGNLKSDRDVHLEALSGVSSQVFGGTQRDAFGGALSGSVQRTAAY
jgi:hypothetical protein